MAISKDMQFYYEVRGKRLNLYNRVESASVQAQDNCKDTLNLLAQVNYKGKLEDSVQRAFRKIDVSLDSGTTAIEFSVTEIGSYGKNRGRYDQNKKEITHFRKN